MGHHDHSVLPGEMPIDEDQPTPGPDDEPEALPASVQRRPQQRESPKGVQAGAQARSSVRRQAVDEEKPAKVLSRSLRDLHAGHWLEVVE